LFDEVAFDFYMAMETCLSDPVLISGSVCVYWFFSMFNYKIWKNKMIGVGGSIKLEDVLCLNLS